MSREPTARDGALSADELAAIVAAVDSDLRGARIHDVARLDGRDDLLLFVERPDGRGRTALQIAVDASRARVCTTRRRFARTAFETGPLVDRLRERFVDSELRSITRPDPDDRRVRIVCHRADTELAIEVELFGNRGLWCVTDGPEQRILELSRLPNIRGRELRPGSTYVPPQKRAAKARPGDATPGPDPKISDARFRGTGAELLEAVDEHFTTRDTDTEHRSEVDTLLRVLDRATSKAEQRVQGLETQLQSMDRAAELRRDADLLLAYGFALERGATELRAPHPDDPDCEVVIPRTPGQSVQAQAEKLYSRARKYEDGRTHAFQQLATARSERDVLHALGDGMRDPVAPPSTDRIAEVREALIARGALQRARTDRKPPKSHAKTDKTSRQALREGFRRFVSIEGLPIYVGRNNAQNDRLSIRFARGNDLWFHVGAGYAGSHVVIRLDKNRSASLESLLDAGTLAAYYSKIRGTHLCEVIYTRAKHVSKPKGLPPGRVVATQTKSLRIRFEPSRLERLLESGPRDEP